MNKAIFDKEVPTRNLITTVVGVIAMVIPILAVVGLITPEQSEGLSTHLTIIGNAVVAIVGAVTSLILIFKAKDA